ncbi:MAG: hypothetical protein ACRDUW_01775 [Pseudonocardiaceae bacterium]
MVAVRGLMVGGDRGRGGATGRCLAGGRLAGGIIVNLLSFPGFFDIALRDFGLLIGAIALARRATRYAPGWRTS